jgi:hypothetical protein
MQRPTAISTSHTGLEAHSRPWAWGEVRLRGMRGRHTGIVGILARLLRFGLKCGKPGFQELHLRPQRHNESILFQL